MAQDFLYEQQHHFLSHKVENVRLVEICQMCARGKDIEGECKGPECFRLELNKVRTFVTKKVKILIKIDELPDKTPQYQNDTAGFYLAVEKGQPDVHRIMDTRLFSGSLSRHRNPATVEWLPVMGCVWSMNCNRQM